jgi:hypothetical protein
MSSLLKQSIAAAPCIRNAAMPPCRHASAVPACLPSFFLFYPIACSVLSLYWVGE